MSLSSLSPDIESIHQLHSRLENLVVEGRHAECRDILDGSSPRQIPRAWAARFGEIAFRVHHPAFTLKVLHRFIYPENTFDAPASDQEKIIYVSALYTFGAIQEAHEILNSIAAKEEPDVWFHRAGAYFCAWDYEAGIPFFKRYIQSPKIDAYKRVVGKVNLASAYIFTCDWVNASQLLEEIKSECEANRYRLLLGNCYELLAQVQIFQKNYDQADVLLKKALEILKDQNGFYALYVEKWTIVSQVLKAPTTENLKQLQALREKAFSIGHWNTVRECDLFEGVATQNADLIRKVIMGTPYEPYRKRVRKLFETNLIAKGQYRLRLANTTTPAGETLSFDPYKKEPGTEALYEKPLLLALYNALTEDFYRPANIGTLFQNIYPDEKFNPYTSPARILQLLRRLNKWFAANSHSLQVSFKKSEFRLTSTQDVCVIVQRGVQLTVLDGKLNQLKSSFQGRMFSAVDVCSVLGISKTSANRFLSEAMKDGYLIKDKGRVGRTYCFAAPNKKRRAA